MKIKFYTITTTERCYDLPKDMPVPKKGEVVFINDKTIIINNVNYHINKNQYSISVMGYID